MKLNMEELKEHASEFVDTLSVHSDEWYSSEQSIAEDIFEKFYTFLQPPMSEVETLKQRIAELEDCLNKPKAKPNRKEFEALFVQSDKFLLEFMGTHPMKRDARIRQALVQDDDGEYMEESTQAAWIGFQLGH